MWHKVYRCCLLHFHTTKSQSMSYSTHSRRGNSQFNNWSILRWLSLNSNFGMEMGRAGNVCYCYRDKIHWNKQLCISLHYPGRISFVWNKVNYYMIKNNITHKRSNCRCTRLSYYTEYIGNFYITYNYIRCRLHTDYNYYYMACISFL